MPDWTAQQLFEELSHYSEKDRKKLKLRCVVYDQTGVYAGNLDRLAYQADNTELSFITDRGKDVTP